MTEDPLVPASHAEMVAALTYGLRFDAHGKAHRQASELAARIAAETLAATLAQSGFVLMKRAGASPPRTPGG